MPRYFSQHRGGSLAERNAATGTESSPGIASASVECPAFLLRAVSGARSLGAGVLVRGETLASYSERRAGQSEILAILPSDSG